jgi:predicted transcriptional regulator
MNQSKIRPMIDITRVQATGPAVMWRLRGFRAGVSCSTNVSLFEAAMPTTTLRLSPALRDRIAKLTENTETTAHSFMLDAIAEKVANAELRRDYLAEGNARLANLLETGVGVEWPDMRRYLVERARGRSPLPPKASKWRG